MENKKDSGTRISFVASTLVLKQIQHRAKENGRPKLGEVARDIVHKAVRGELVYKDGSKYFKDSD